MLTADVTDYPPSPKAATRQAQMTFALKAAVDQSNSESCRQFCAPVRIDFYAADGYEPPHVHAERHRNTAKFWIEPVTFHSSAGFARHELLDLYRLISDNQQLLLQRWYDYFGRR